jgi:hypothetical protein
MANILDDNSVIPSYLGSFAQGDHQDTGAMSNLALRTGEVREIVYPDDDKSVSRRFIEYTVEVQEKEGNGPGTSTKYAGCILLNLFGSVADIFRFTLRVDDSQQPPEDGIGVGAKVALLCVNGNTTKAVIVGGFRDTGTDKEGDKQQGKDKKDDGHNLFFEFNGAQASINKDGELQIRYRGQTKVDGTLSDDANEDAEGSTVIFNKDGDIKLYTKDEKQFIHLNHKDKKLDILADEEWHVKVNKKLSFEAGDTVTVKGDKTCTIEMSDKVYIKSAGVHVGDATDAWLLADTYRKAESQMLKDIASTMQSIQGLLSTAASTLTAASAANAPPMVGGAAAATPFAAAGTALNSAAPMFAKMAASIQVFEAQASTYLSKKNKND